MKLSSALIFCAAACQVVICNNLFENWSSQDIIQYLKDTGDSAKKDADTSLEELKAYASQKWSEHAQPKPWWKVWPDERDQDNWWNFQSEPSTTESISNWLFDTWSAKDLRKTLRNAGVKFDTDTSYDNLKSLAKENFDKINKKLGSSGYYSTESYFNQWDDYDLKAWLDKHGVTYDKAKANKDELLSLVRKNIYKASQVYSEERLSALESLDLAKKQLYDKSNKLKSDLFDSWSSDDIYDWLQSHSIQVKENAKENRDQLLDVANKNINLLEDDIKWYTEASKSKASALLTKSTDSVNSVWEAFKGKLSGAYHDDNVINDTFLLGVQSWPKKRLQNFLDARGVKYHLLSTKAELLKLVYENRNKPLKSWENAYDEAKHWWNKQNIVGKAKSTGSDILNKVSDYESTAVDSFQRSFDSMSNSDLIEYLKSYSVKPSDLKTLSKEQLVERAKENTQWFFGVPQKPWYSRAADNTLNFAKRAYAVIRP
ncbi:Msc1 [Kluyveromyces lactis]|nr:Msc1 [Kluyveromyces lactis]